MTPSPRTDPHAARRDARARAAEGVDVLVIGAGITGAGVALDAVTRGYTVAVVERDDIASGTSSKSSKLVHGGIRYLARGDVPMVAESVRERDRLRKLAPHLVRPLGFIYPLADRATQLQLKAGLTLYDTLALGRNVRGHRRLTSDEVAEELPGIGLGAALGGYRFYDCQTDDARLTLQILQVARGYGVAALNHAEVRGLLQDGDRVVGAQVADRLTGDEVEIPARWVVSATGVWADTLRGLAPPAPADSITPSMGTHLTFPSEALPVRQAAIVASGADDGRMNFVIPWGEQVYVGTTDGPYTGPRDAPGLTETDVGYLLGSVNAAFATSLTIDDAIGAWAGLRPLLTRGEGPTTDLSRRHAITEGPAGLVSVTGGKLTTYRHMAEEVVDHLTAGDGSGSACMTTQVPLGASGTPEDGLGRTVASFAALGADRATAASLYHRHGERAAEVLTFCQRHDEAGRLVDTLPYLVGEVRWAVRHELAMTLDDVLQRRLRVSLRHAGAGGPAIADAAAIAAEELGWDTAERERQITAYLDAVARERGLVGIASISSRSA